MLHHYLPQASAFLTLIAPIVYIRAILRGEAKPHRTTRFVIFVISLLAAVSLFSGGDRIGVWLAGASALQASVILLLTIKNGMGGTEPTDIVCLILAAMGIVLWKVTSEPILALYAAIFADVVGCVPTLIKIYHHPHTEIWSYYAFDVVSPLLILAATTSWTLRGIAFPVYILLINLTIVLMIIIRGRQLHELGRA